MPRYSKRKSPKRKSSKKKSSKRKSPRRYRSTRKSPTELNDENLLTELNDEIDRFCAKVDFTSSGAPMEHEHRGRFLEYVRLKAWHVTYPGLEDVFDAMNEYRLIITHVKVSDPFQMKGVAPYALHRISTALFQKATDLAASRKIVVEGVQNDNMQSVCRTLGLAPNTDTNCYADFDDLHRPKVPTL